MNPQDSLITRIGTVFDPMIGDIAADLVVGRTTQLAQVLDTLESGHIPVISGKPGVGKTLLVSCVERAASGDVSMLDDASVRTLGLSPEKRFETFRVSFDNTDRDPQDELCDVFRKWLRGEEHEPESDDDNVLDLAYQVSAVYQRPILVFVDNLTPSEQTERFSGLLREVKRSGLGELKFVLAGKKARSAELFSAQARLDNPNLIYLSVPEMAENEVATLITRRFNLLHDLAIQRPTVLALVAIACGNPYVAVYLAQRSALTAARAGIGRVARRHVETAAGDYIAHLRDITLAG